MAEKSCFAGDDDDDDDDEYHIPNSKSGKP
jgi:hypothetical protein